MGDNNPEMVEGPKQDQLNLVMHEEIKDPEIKEKF